MTDRLAVLLPLVAACGQLAPDPLASLQDQVRSVEARMERLPCAAGPGRCAGLAPPPPFDPATLADGDPATTPVTWGGLADVPADVRDGDDDAFGRFGCAAGEVLVSEGGGWRCGEEFEGVDDVAPSGVGCARGLPVRLRRGALECETNPQLASVESDHLGVRGHPFPASPFLPRWIVEVDGRIDARRHSGWWGLVHLLADEGERTLVLAAPASAPARFGPWSVVPVAVEVVGVAVVGTAEDDARPFLVQAAVTHGSVSAPLDVVSDVVVDAGLVPWVDTAWACLGTEGPVVAATPPCETPFQVVRVHFPDLEDDAVRWTWEVSARAAYRNPGGYLRVLVDPR